MILLITHKPDFIGEKPHSHLGAAHLSFLSMAINGPGRHTPTLSTDKFDATVRVLPRHQGSPDRERAVLKSPLTKRYQSLRQDYHCWLSRIKWTSGERQYILTFCKNILKPDFWLKSDIETPYKSILQFKDQNTPPARAGRLGDGMWWSHMPSWICNT